VFLFLLALAVRVLAALPQQQPNYMDAAYSYVNALNLAAGRGFVEDFVWNYLGNPSPPPHPSHLYWMPLTSILAWLGLVIGGISYRAAQMPFVFVSALLAPISYWTAASLTGHRRHGWLAGLLAIFSGFYFPFWTAIDNFAPFAVAGSLTLLLAWQGMGGSQKTHYLAVDHGSTPSAPPRPDRLWFLAAGACTGLAHLARADGPLLLAAVVAYLFIRTLSAPRFTLPALRPALYLLLGYALLMAPWFIRNWQVAGTILPAAGSQTIWLTGYDELFSYGREFSAQSFLAQGLGPALRGRWWALTINLQTVLAVWGMIFLTPLAAIGSWQLRRRPLVQLAGLYGLLLLGAMTVVFAFPGARGGLFHSGAALLPFIYATALAGLEVSVDWAAARRRHWDSQAAQRVFGAGLVVMAVALSSFIYYNRVLKNDAWNNSDLQYATLATWMASHDPEATVMLNNPPAYRYHGGGLSVVVPNEDLEVTLQIARRYGVDYLILDRNHPAPLAAVYNQPSAQPGLELVKTFAPGTAHEIYVFKIVQP
jgi:4-amino-4-deoxy-L-arabinose transferase-like glycosyltransferase